MDTSHSWVYMSKHTTCNICFIECLTEYDPLWNMHDVKLLGKTGFTIFASYHSLIFSYFLKKNTF